MKSRYEIEAAMRDFLAQHDGSAKAGEVVAHLESLGFANSTIRWVADRTVTKSREGNSFLWSMPIYRAPRPSPPPSASPEWTPPEQHTPKHRRELEDIAAEHGYESPEDLTDSELDLIADLAQSGDLDKQPDRAPTHF